MKETLHITTANRYHNDAEIEGKIPKIGRKDTSDYLRNIYDGYSEVARGHSANADKIRDAPIYEAIEKGDTSRHRDRTPEEEQTMEYFQQQALEHGRIATAANDIADVLMANANKVAAGFEGQFNADAITPELFEELAKKFDAKVSVAERTRDPASDKYTAAAELARLLAESFPRVANEVDEFAKLQKYMREGDQAA